MTIYQDEVSDVDQERERLPGVEHWVPTVRGVHQNHERTPDTQVPKRDWNHASALLFRVQPLHEEAEEEDELPREAEQQPIWTLNRWVHR